MNKGQASKRNRARGNGRRGPNRNTVFDSNGPDVRVRGKAQQVVEKYLSLARDAFSAGERVASENYFQHADHYQRMMNEIAGQRAEQQQQQQQQQQHQSHRDPRGRRGHSHHRPADHGPSDSGEAPTPAEPAAQAAGEPKAVTEPTAAPEPAPVDVPITTAPAVESAAQSATDAPVEKAPRKPARRPRTSTRKPKDTPPEAVNA